MAGHLGDRFGRRRALIIGLVGFAAASAVAGLSGNLGQLIGARAIIGVFAALIFPATLALITTIFVDAKEKAAAIAVWAATTGVAVALGPVTGGWLLENYIWPSLFWINVPIAAVTVIAIGALVPESKSSHAGRLDALGGVLSISGVAVLIWGIIEGPRYGWTSPTTVAALTLGALIFAAFAAWEIRTPTPLLDVALFRNRRFTGASLSISVGYFAMFGYIFVAVQYLQVVKGYSPLDSGIRTLPFAGALIVITPISVFLARRLGTASTIGIGLVLMAAGMFLTATGDAYSQYTVVILPSMLLLAAGMGLSQTPATEAIMTAVPRDKAGAGSAVNDTTREIGGTLGVAVMGSVQATFYSLTLDGRLTGLGIPEEFRRQGTSSITAGIDLISQAPEAARGLLVAAARESFAHAFIITSIVGGAVAVVGAIASVALIGRTCMSSSSEENQ